MLGSPMHEVNHPDIYFVGHPGSMHDYGGSSQSVSEFSHSFNNSNIITTTAAITPSDTSVVVSPSAEEHGSCPCFCRSSNCPPPPPPTTTISQHSDLKATATTTTTTTTTTLISDEEGFAFSGFEGPEKKLEVIFRPAPMATHTPPQALRLATQQQWQSMLDEAHCKIISITSNRHLDCYVLSESSLFVYPLKIVLKTCGTTTLLFCIPKLLAIAKEFDLEVERVFFSRKNYVFPHKQLFPHTSFVEETQFLDQFFSGSCYILGSIKKDHWYLYMADHSAISEHNALGTGTSCLEQPDEHNLEIMMHDLDPRVMDQFFKGEDFVSSSRVTETSGISDLLPGSVIDAFMFDPCGYSMNGLLESSYSTIHITPEKQCSFVSFETNVSASYLCKHLGLNHEQLIQRVLHTFKPGRATVTLRSLGAHHHHHHQHHHSRDELNKSSLLSDEGFVVCNSKTYRFDGGVSLSFFNVFRESD